MRTFTYDRRLQWSECDAGGIVFFPNYARWMVDGLNEMLLSLGINPNEAGAATTRGGLPVLQLTMKFSSAPALYQRVTHQIAVVKLGGKSLTFVHRFLREGELLMEAEETRVWAQHDLTNPQALRALPIPDGVRALLEQND
ncbi:MAG TPA: thioesterase family protein [Candidatus Sulfotelmatobacter sp.]|nr:thioesterase family protein [Candidatus Sulfotelmatobacter sp.]